MLLSRVGRAVLLARTVAVDRAVRPLCWACAHATRAAPPAGVTHDADGDLDVLRRGWSPPPPRASPACCGPGQALGRALTLRCTPLTAINDVGLQVGRAPGCGSRGSPRRRLS
jgi:hypothetical protein